MKYDAAVYYAFCKDADADPRAYKKYQREIADQLLNYGFQRLFDKEFSQAYVEKGAHGKPFWNKEQEIHFNISNTKGLVVCALSRVEVGVDAEYIRSFGQAVIRRCCTQEEAAFIAGAESEEENQGIKERFFQIWTLKESYIKMIGQGMYFPMRDAAFFLSGREENQEISCSRPGYFVQKRLGEYWISLCTQKKQEIVWKEIILP